MSYISKKLGGFVLRRCRSITLRKFNCYYQKNVKLFSVESEYHLPKIGFSTHIQTYATKSADDKSHESKILKELILNKVSLQFDKFIKMHPCLLKSYSINLENGFNILKSCSQLIDRSAEERKCNITTFDFHH